MAVIDNRTHVIIGSDVQEQVVQLQIVRGRDVYIDMFEDASFAKEGKDPLATVQFDFTDLLAALHVFGYMLIKESL